tara:strand:+ start:6555 stop:7928 length:1374 start_codon:yes stop_codon:yes gene_type:complete
MINLQLSEAAEILNACLQGNDTRIVSIGTDTRNLKKGDLFIAISGKNFDGHDFVSIAEEKGAIAAIVEKEIEGKIPLLKVENSIKSLGKLAAAWRKKSNSFVVGITGSNGKTTLKEMCNSIFKQNHSVLSTEGNLNNHIGLPLTLLRLQGEEIGIIEMGASAPGDIEYLTNLTRPNIAILNNAGRAHLEGFGDTEGVARAKAEIIKGLDKKGTFIFNADDKFSYLWEELSKNFKQVTFGIQNKSVVSSNAESYSINWIDYDFHTSFEVRMDEEIFDVHLHLAGLHNRMNALAAIAASYAANINIPDIKTGLESLMPISGRLSPMRGLGGCRLIDDTYNANPDSVIAGVDVLKAAPGRKTLILGDLVELGKNWKNYYSDLGKYIFESGIERLVTCGENSKHTLKEFSGETFHFRNKESLIEELAASLSTDDSILIKGSHKSNMNLVVKAFSHGEIYVS